MPVNGSSSQSTKVNLSRFPQCPRQLKTVACKDDGDPRVFRRAGSIRQRAHSSSGANGPRNGLAATIITTDKEKGKQGDNGQGPMLPPQNGQQSSVRSSFQSRNRSSSPLLVAGKSRQREHCLYARQNPRIVIEKWEPVAGDGQEHRTQKVMVY